MFSGRNCKRCLCICLYRYFADIPVCQGCVQRCLRRYGFFCLDFRSGFRLLRLRLVSAVTGSTIDADSMTASTFFTNCRFIIVPFCFSCLIYKTCICTRLFLLLFQIQHHPAYGTITPPFTNAMRCIYSHFIVQCTNRQA